MIVKLINKIIQVEDAIELEEKQMKEKYLVTHDLIDLEVRNIFRSGKVTKSLIKCYHSFNHYGIRDSKINQQNTR